MDRPFPPEWMARSRVQEAFIAAPELEAWAYATFINEGATLENPDHAHLQWASIGFLWTNVPNQRGMLPIVGEVTEPTVQGSKWVRKRWEQQLAEFFGPRNLHFLITIDAVHAAAVDDASFCALIEHELYHIAQDKGAFGEPKFSKDGRPKIALRRHDVEEFVGIVRRYGVGHAAGATAELVKAAQRPPEIAPAQIEMACGTCGLKIA